MRNLEGHTIDAHGVFTSGGDVGFIATLLATMFPVLLAPLLVGSVDVWTFWKAVSTLLLGESGISPSTGFDAAPVLIGAGIHLFVGTVIGGLFSVVISLLGVDGFAPTAVVGGFMLAVLAFDLTWIPLSRTLVPALDEIPLLFAGWMLVAFGILLASGIARWRSKWDGTACPHGVAEQTSWLLVAHERAIAATAGTLALVSVGIAVAGINEIRLGVALPFLAIQLAATATVVVHAFGEARARRELQRPS